MMKALYLSMRLAGTDGVSLETEKLASALASFGIERVDCAGEVSTQGAYLIPEMHFTDPVALELGQRAFSGTESDPELEAALFERAAFLRERIAEVVAEVRPDLLVMQNVWAVPMQLPLARALADIAAESALPCLSHEHDYYWERERFKQTRIPEYLDRYFPFHAPNIRHLCINSPAQRDLRQHRGLEATLLPNVFDFANPAPGIDAYNRDFREAIGLSDNQHLILQPTRVIPRKGIELAIDLLAKLSDPDNVLVITHHAGDEGLDYLHRLERHAEEPTPTSSPTQASTKVLATPCWRRSTFASRRW
jgi:glycosyltransferase involved in cell wall biosynthesis